MARHLSSRNCEAIVDIIDGWPAETKLTWQRLIDQIGNRLGIHPTRQTLNRHADIKHAYQCRKNNTPQVQLSPSERILREQVEQLTAEKCPFLCTGEPVFAKCLRYGSTTHTSGVSRMKCCPSLYRVLTGTGRTDGQQRISGKAMCRNVPEWITGSDADLQWSL